MSRYLSTGGRKPTFCSGSVRTTANAFRRRGRVAPTTGPTDQEDFPPLIAKQHIRARLALAALVVEIGCVLVANAIRSVSDWAWHE